MIEMLEVNLTTATLPFFEIAKRPFWEIYLCNIIIERKHRYKSLHNCNCGRDTNGEREKSQLKDPNQRDCIFEEWV